MRCAAPEIGKITDKAKNLANRFFMFCIPVEINLTVWIQIVPSLLAMERSLKMPLTSITHGMLCLFDPTFCSAGAVRGPNGDPGSLSRFRSLAAAASRPAMLTSSRAQLCYCGEHIHEANIVAQY